MPSAGMTVEKQMTRTVYVNGDYLPETEAKVSIFDRAFLMGDGVYEVVSVLDSKLLDFDGHLVRLQRSLDALAMKNPLSSDDYLQIMRKLVAENDIGDGLVYLQVTRGNPGDRDFAFPPEDTQPTVVMLNPMIGTMRSSSSIRAQAVPSRKTGAACCYGCILVFANNMDIRWKPWTIKPVMKRGSKVSHYL